MKNYEIIFAKGLRAPHRDKNLGLIWMSRTAKKGEFDLDTAGALWYTLFIQNITFFATDGYVEHHKGTKNVPGEFPAEADRLGITSLVRE